MRVFVFITWMGLVGAACSGADSGGALSGVIGGPCLDGEICDQGLLCVSGYCVAGEGNGHTTDVQSSDGGAGDDANQAPTVAITAPSDDDIVQVGDVVTFAATLSDDRDAPETLNATWSSDLSGNLGAGTITTSGLTTLETDALVGGLHTIALMVTDSGGLESTATVILTVNAPPGAPALSISPEVPHTADDLTISITEAAQDPNRDSSALTSTYSWYRDSALEASHTGPFLPSSATQKGELWQVRVTAFDGFQQGPAGTAQVTIQNTPPSCSQAVILPSAGSTDTEFTCSCVERSDADGDEPADTCTFYDGDAALTTVDAIDGTCTLPASITERGMAITCTLTPTDDEVSGDPAESDEVLVQNALPTTPAAELTPLEGTVETLFTCTQNGDSTDSDGDALTYQTSWVVNDYENPGTTTTSVTADQIKSDEAGTPAKRGDTLSCRLRASDGLGLSPHAESNAVVLGNSPPNGGSVITGPPGAKEGDVLTCQTAEATDLDGDTITWAIAWFVGDIEVEGETETTLSSEHFDKGDTVHCVATPSDGTDTGEPVESKLSVVIQNTLPTIATVALSPDQTNRTGSFTCAYDGWSDPDPTDTEATVTFSWYLVVSGGDDMLIEGAAEAELSAATFTPEAQVYCRVTPTNGGDAGESLDSALGLIINTKPTVGGVTLTPDEAYADSLLICTPDGGSDLDGDQVSFLYNWQLNGEPVEGAAEATLSGVFGKGQTIRCAVTPFDGYEEGSAKLSNPVTIGNKLPLITGVTLSPAYGAPCDSYTCQADDIIDPDQGDNLVKGYSWTLNGEQLDTQSPTLTNPLLTPGDVLQCTITVTDGTVGPPPEFATMVVQATSNESEVYNTPPSVDAVVISEAAPVVGDMLHCVPQGFSDAECDPTPSFVFDWFLGATEIEEANEATLDTNGLEVGTEVACRAIPFDGIEYGAPVLSEAVTLQPSPPEPPVVSISSPEGADGDATCLLVEEVEGLVYTYYWSVNGEDEVLGQAVWLAADTQHCDLLSCRAVADNGFVLVSSNIAEASMPLGDDCDDNNVCTSEQCLEEGGCTSIYGALGCNDGLFCNGVETCHSLNGCQPGTAPLLDDGVSCTDDACDEAADIVTNTPNDAHCATGALCITDTCHPINDCVSSVTPDCCGNENIEGGEACDDGNDVDGDGCSSECLEEFICPEECVIEHTIEDSPCTPDNTCNCLPGYAGDDCSEILCGNGALDEGEQCDEGLEPTSTCLYGLQSCQICGSDCQWTEGSTSYCGDGLEDSDNGEQCDEGAESCAVCAPDEVCNAGECVSVASPCGDLTYEGCCDGLTLKWCENGQVWTGECESSCGWAGADIGYLCGSDGEDPSGQFPLHCGNDCGADCDAGACAYGESDCDVCDVQCQWVPGVTSYCGDNIEDSANGETCDDGNTEDGDGCSATCQEEFSCGNNVILNVDGQDVLSTTYGSNVPSSAWLGFVMSPGHKLFEVSALHAETGALQFSDSFDNPGNWTTSTGCAGCGSAVVSGGQASGGSDWNVFLYDAQAVSLTQPTTITVQYQGNVSFRLYDDFPSSCSGCCGLCGGEHPGQWCGGVDSQNAYANHLPTNGGGYQSDGSAGYSVGGGSSHTLRVTITPPCQP